MPVTVNRATNGISAGDWFYWSGDESTAGSWRTGIINDKKVTQHNDAGTWVNVSVDNWDGN